MWGGGYKNIIIDYLLVCLLYSLFYCNNIATTKNKDVIFNASIKPYVRYCLVLFNYIKL
jgi:hypothetical protein